MKKNKIKLQETGYRDLKGNSIIEGDILVGKTDILHPMAQGDLKERDFVKLNRNPFSELFWNWNGHNLKNVCHGVLKVGTIFKNPEILL